MQKSESKVSESSQSGSSYCVRGPVKLIQQHLDPEETKADDEQLKKINLAGLVVNENQSCGETASLDIASQSAKPKDLNSENYESPDPQKLVQKFKKVGLVSKDDQKLESENHGANKKMTRANPKRIQSLQHVVGGLGINTHTYNQKEQETESSKDQLEPCQEIMDDEILNTQVELHQLHGSIGTNSEKTPDAPRNQIGNPASWKKLTEDQF